MCPSVITQKNSVDGQRCGQSVFYAGTTKRDAKTFKIPFGQKLLPTNLLNYTIVLKESQVLIPYFLKANASQILYHCKQRRAMLKIKSNALFVSLFFTSTNQFSLIVFGEILLSIFKYFELNLYVYFDGEYPTFLLNSIEKYL